MRKSTAALLLVSGLASPFLFHAARADACADLKTVLSGLRAQDPIQARVDFALSSSQGKTEDGKPEPAKEARVSAQVQAGPEGLRVLWAPEQIARASGSGEEHQPVRRAMDALTVSQLNDYLNGAPELLRNLEHAELTSVADTVWENRPARLLTLKLNPPLSEKDRKYIKQLDTSARIWIDPDGFPLAAESQVHVKGRALLVITFEQNEREEYRFLHRGDRLVVLRHVKESSGSGGGETGAQKTSASVAIEG